jgi:ribonucleoside-diphosphate reductase alpha chain
MQPTAPEAAPAGAAAAAPGASGAAAVYARELSRFAHGLEDVDVERVARRVLSGLYAGASTRERDDLAIRTAASLMVEEPDHGRLAARLLSAAIAAGVEAVGVRCFSQSVAAGRRARLLNERVASFVDAHRDALDAAIDPAADERFEYFGLRTLHDRYLLREPETRALLERPQYFFLRVACGLAETLEDALELYGLFSRLEYLPSSPTLFNAGTAHEQLASCFLLDSPADDLRAIYDRYTDVALLSKFAGGIGLAWHRVRSRGSLIRSTNGHSTGVVPWLKTLDASVAAVNQGGRRKGACCVYLESWHADIEEFLELRDNTGDAARRTFNLNLANWVPDLFMRRVEQDGEWSLFDPSRVPRLVDLWGEEFEAAYREAEAAGLAARRVRARELYGHMMRTLAETGNGWMTFKDTCNRTCNQTAAGDVVHLSNLCTEIVEVTGDGEAAVCNLGSVNLSRHLDGARFDFEKLRRTVRRALRQLDRVIDLNFYPIASTRASNRRWRPVGLGVMGLQDVFFRLGLPFDDPAARALSRRIQEEVYCAALEASCELAEERGAHPGFPETRAARGELQPELWGVTPEEPERWQALRERIGRSGLRNALLVAIAPTATIASIAGCGECVEPQVSNLFRRETLSGDFLQVNRHLVAALKRRGRWTPELRDRIKRAEGSLQGIEEIPEDLRRVFRTAWEIPMRSLIDMAADRGAFVDQSQSLNLFVESPDVPRLSSMYFYAWKRGLKTTYYLRSRPATRIAQTTVQAVPRDCSLESPEACESCQ